MTLFEQNILNLYGQKGRQWLDDLPEYVEQIAKIYGLSALTPLENLTYHYVLSGFQGDQPIILKIGFDKGGFQREAAALRAFSGFGAIHALEESDGILLLERATPGISLKSHFSEQDDQAIHIAANLIQQLHKAPLPSEPSLFPSLKDWLILLDQDWDIPKVFLERARSLRDHLLTTTPQEKLLHGDLHHDNILQKEDEWLAIDPKGVLGDPTYEVAAFIRNPMPELLSHKDASFLIYNRIQRFAQILEFSSQRIWDWFFVQAVLSWTWALEDKGNVSYFEKLTDCLDSLPSSDLS